MAIGLTAILLLVGGILVAPFLIAATNEFIPDSPTWFPFFGIFIFSFLLFVVSLLRWLAIGLMIGVVAFGVILAFAPDSWFPFLPEVEPPFGG